jgi:hypothetical protein
MTAFWRVTSVCVKIRPFKEEPVVNMTAALTKRMPSICEPVPIVMDSAIDQKIFFASAPPLRTTLMFAACVTFFDVWMMKISSAVPLKMRSPVEMRMSVVKVWTPGPNIAPPN